MLTEEVKQYVDKSVLCWLATTSLDHMPNVSPKEAFTYYGDSHIIVANIASPQTVENIRQNDSVCISFIDVFVQKGYQLKGKATILEEGDVDFEKRKKCLQKLIGDEFPFSSIIDIKVERVKPIIAPKYFLYSETTEQDQIKSAIKMYSSSMQI